MVGTCVSAQMLFIGAMLTRTICSAPILACSMVSFSLPSALLLKTLMVCLPPDSCLEALAHELDGRDGRVVVGVDVGRAELGGLCGQRGQCGEAAMATISGACGSSFVFLWVVVVKMKLEVQAPNIGSGMPCAPGRSANTPPASGWSDRSPPGRIDVTNSVSSFGAAEGAHRGLLDRHVERAVEPALGREAVHQAGVVAADPVAAVGVDRGAVGAAGQGIHVDEQAAVATACRWRCRSRRPRSSARSGASPTGTSCGRRG